MFSKPFYIMIPLWGRGWEGAVANIFAMFLS